MDAHGKLALIESNQGVLSLFKDLVLSQSMAVPVAAMNALVLKLKVCMCLHVIVLVHIDLLSTLYVCCLPGLESEHVDAPREGASLCHR